MRSAHGVTHRLRIPRRVFFRRVRMPCILIVDDEAHIRLLIAQTLEELEEEGVEILTAENGEEALEIIRSEKPRLVFLDVMMPKMNGFDVCRRVKTELGMRDVY